MRKVCNEDQLIIVNENLKQYKELTDEEKAEFEFVERNALEETFELARDCGGYEIPF